MNTSTAFNFNALTVLILGASLCGMQTVAQSGVKDGYSPADGGPGRYVVQLKDAVDGQDVARDYGLIPDKVFTRTVNGFAAGMPEGFVQRLRNDTRVASVAKDHAVRAIAKGGKKPGGGGAPSTQIVPAGVMRIGASPGTLGFRGAGVGVAVVDTGLDFDHVDLPVAPQSFVSPSAGSSAQDDNGHGTHVGGIIAALNNTNDVVGVAPSARLYAVKVLNAAGSGYDSDVILGLEWIAANMNAVDPPIRVVNMSLGRNGTLADAPALRSAVATLSHTGITVVVAAGNDPHVEVSNKVTATYPEVLAVASTTARTGNSSEKRFDPIKADTASYFTTDGAWDFVKGIGVTISAPGEEAENILRGARLQSVGILSTRLGGGTTRMSGTSMAAPHVAGVVALLYEQAGGTISPELVRRKLTFGADAVDAPHPSPSVAYTDDNDPEGILYAPGALAAPDKF